MYRIKNKSLFRSKVCILFIIIVIAILSSLNPIYPNEQFLQHLGTLMIGSVLVIDLLKNKLHLGAFICFSIFIIIHIIGARWIYSYVPYEDWFLYLFNMDLGSYIGNDRNHYDRFVHFAFGILIFPYLYSLFSEIPVKRILIILIAWTFVQTLSVFYELFEWMLTHTVSENAAKNYNGQQGDIWDAQKDMALAMLGSTIMAICYLFKKNK